MTCVPAKYGRIVSRNSSISSNSNRRANRNCTTHLMEEGDTMSACERECVSLSLCVCSDWEREGEAQLSQ